MGPSESHTGCDSITVIPILPNERQKIIFGKKVRKWPFGEWGQNIICRLNSGIFRIFELILRGRWCRWKWCDKHATNKKLTIKILQVTFFCKCETIIIRKTSVYIQCYIEIIKYRKNAELTKAIIAQQNQLLVFFFHCQDSFLGFKGRPTSCLSVLGDRN